MLPFLDRLQSSFVLSKCAGELSEEKIDKIVTIMQNPHQYKIPKWFLTKQREKFMLHAIKIINLEIKRYAFILDD